MRSLLNTNRLCEQPVWYLSGTLSPLLASLTATAQNEQKKHLVVGATALQWASGYSTGPVVGLNYEHRFTHSRFEQAFVTGATICKARSVCAGDQYFKKPKAEVNVGFKYRF